MCLLLQLLDVVIYLNGVNKWLRKFKKPKRIIEIP